MEVIIFSLLMLIVVMCTLIIAMLPEERDDFK
jgi:hypothetical protein